MKEFLGRNILNVKKHNMQAILLSLLNSIESGTNQPLSRIELARKTNLSSTTITNLVAELIEKGSVAEEKNPCEDQTRSVGRPRTKLFLVPNARFVIGIHIEIGIYRIALMNLHAEIINNKLVNFPISAPAQEVLQGFCDVIQELLEVSQIDRRLILGVGVGASGLVDHQKGVNIYAPNLDWNNVPIRDYLERELGLPVVVENNVRAMALGEAYFGIGQNAQSLAFVYGRTGVGAGFVVDRQLFRGSNTGAGEIGHMILVPENGQPCRCGKRGCLETLVSETAMVQQARAAAKSDPESTLGQLMMHPGECVEVDCLFQAARLGDLAAKEILQKVSYSLGIALTNLVNIFNPELIILGGLFSQANDLILPLAQKTLKENAFAGLGEKVELVTTHYGWRVGVTGAAALALLAFFYRPPIISQPVNGNINPPKEYFPISQLQT